VTVRIRDAGSGEAGTILEAYEWLFEPPGRRPPRWDAERARAALAAAIDSPDSAVLVAEESGALVGFCTAYMTLESVRFGRRCWVEELAVHPDRRSEGIGARLLSDARAWAAERGATHLKLDSSVDRTDAQRFYERERPAWRSISYSWEL
jgi:GNAT superfamily N-acetyltransferase